MSAAEPILHIADIRSLSPEVAATSLPVHVRGVVTWRSGRDEFALQDDSGGTWGQVFGARVRRDLGRGTMPSLDRVSEGMELEIEGVNSCRRLRPGDLAGDRPHSGPEGPAARAVPGPHPVFRWSGIRRAHRGAGVILVVQPMIGGWKLRMQAGPDTILVMASENVIRDPQAILDAEATVRGSGLRASIPALSFWTPAF